MSRIASDVSSMGKYILIAVNVLWLVLSAVSMIIGFTIFIRMDHSLRDIGRDASNAGAVMLIVLGFLAFFIAALGCCGSCCKNKCVLGIYWVTIVVLMVVEGIAAFLVFHYEGDISYNVKELFRKNFHIYSFGDDRSAATRKVDKIQRFLECCGLERGQEDWFDQWKQYPVSCCGKVNGGYNFCHEIEIERAATMGCFYEIDRFIGKYLAILGWIAIAVFVLQLVSVIFACCLGVSTHKKEAGTGRYRFHAPLEEGDTKF